MKYFCSDCFNRLSEGCIILKSSRGCSVFKTKFERVISSEKCSVLTIISQQTVENSLSVRLFAPVFVIKCCNFTAMSQFCTKWMRNSWNKDKQRWHTGMLFVLQHGWWSFMWVQWITPEKKSFSKSDPQYFFTSASLRFILQLKKSRFQF